MAAESMHDRAPPEEPKVAVRPILMIAGGFILFVALSLVGLDIYFGQKVPDTVTLQRGAFPEPRLQTDPHGDLHRLVASQKEEISEFAWIDKDRGLIRIPVDRAMALVVARGPEALDPLDKPAVTPTPGSRGGAR